MGRFMAGLGIERRRVHRERWSRPVADAVVTGTVQSDPCVDQVSSREID
jgi:hypothetical protein